MSRGPSAVWSFYIAAALAPLVALGVTWLPELRHWHVPDVAIAPGTVSQALAEMDTPLRRELAGYDLLGLEVADESRLRAVADRLRRGEIEIGGGRVAQIDPAFAPADLENPAGSAALKVAGLAVPDLWIRASRGGADLDYLRPARSYINAWLKFEHSSLLPKGLQWNDHAVAERVFVLSRYLLVAKRLPEFTDAEAAAVLEYIVQSGIRLAKPGYYTYRTNHGLMQNIALVHIGAVYPHLPQARELATLGAQRIAEQLPVYLSDEGVVLEHSAGYHRLGVELLSIAARHLEVAGLPAPPNLHATLARAIDTYATLLRPDGTLPSWGDTRSPELPPLAPALTSEAGIGPLRLLPVDSLPPAATTLFAPVSGLAVYRDGAEPVQTLAIWSNFASRAHKHRDEMSLLIWAARTDLLVGSGYWPHDFPLGLEAVSWRGANSPHLIAEPTGSLTTTRLNGYASDARFEFLDLSRTLERSGTLGRQILYLRPDTWVIVDSDSREAGALSAVHWTFGPQIAVEADEQKRALQLKVAGTEDSFTFRTLGCDAGELQLARESRDPFAGWTALSGSAQATTTLIRRCPAHADAMTIITRNSGAARPEIRVEKWTSPHNWTLMAGDQPVFDRASVQLSDGSKFEQQTVRIDAAFHALAGHYARFKESLLPYRVKVSAALGTLWLVQMLLFVPVFRFVDRRSRGASVALGLVVVAGWLGLAAWLHAVYFTA
ncbi:MAG TPA: heparinase II/III family protein [Steroidobacteraceae bacterium]|nr:heparinase II/III family protein [Steroidobacteraceae bacterium]